MPKFWDKLFSLATKRDLTSGQSREHSSERSQALSPGKSPDPLPTDLEAAEMLIEGGLQARRDHPSLLFFTVHKAASSYVGDMLMRIARAHQIIAVDYMKCLFAETHDDEHLDARLILEWVHPKMLTERPPLSPDLAARKDRELVRLFPPQGFQFGPLRVPYLLQELPRLEQYRTLIQLRDPRDCLVSMYYSQAFSHVAPPDPDLKKSFLEQRRQARETTVDAYVLENAPLWLKNFRRYADALQKSPRVKIVKYEQMVLNFPAWLKEVEQVWGFEIESNLRRGLIDQANFNVAEEDIYSHKRQVLPGDHLRKLQPESIRRLNDMYAPVLKELGYPVDAAQAPAA